MQISVGLRNGIIKVGETLIRADRITAIGPVEQSHICEISFRIFGIAEHGLHVPFGMEIHQDNRRALINEANRVRQELVNVWTQSLTTTKGDQ